MQQTPRLGLKKPEGTDQFLRQDFLDNYDDLDTSPGHFICTSTTHPTTWGDNQVGRTIIEANTGAVLYFTSAHTFESIFATDSQSAVNAASIATLTSQLGDTAVKLSQTPNGFNRWINTSTVLGTGDTHSYTFSTFKNTRAGDWLFLTLADFIFPTPVGAGTWTYITTGLTVDGTDAYINGNPYVEDGDITGSGGSSTTNDRRQIMGFGWRHVGAASTHTLGMTVHSGGGASASVTVDRVRVMGWLVQNSDSM